MQHDILGMQTQRYHDACAALERRRQQIEARITVADVQAIVADRLESDDSPLLPALTILLRQQRRLTTAELLDLARAINDLACEAIEDLKENSLADGWSCAGED